MSNLKMLLNVTGDRISAGSHWLCFSDETFKVYRRDGRKTILEVETTDEDLAVAVFHTKAENEGALL